MLEIILYYHIILYYIIILYYSNSGKLLYFIIIENQLFISLLL